MCRLTKLTTSGVVTFGLLPPICPGLMLPVLRYLHQHSGPINQPGGCGSGGCGNGCSGSSKSSGASRVTVVVEVVVMVVVVMVAVQVVTVEVVVDVVVEA